MKEIQIGNNLKIIYLLFYNYNRSIRLYRLNKLLFY